MCFKTVFCSSALATASSAKWEKRFPGNETTSVKSLLLDHQRQEKANTYDSGLTLKETGNRVVIALSIQLRHLSAACL